MNEDQIKELHDLSLSATLVRPDLDIVPDTEEYPWFIREFQKRLQAMEKRSELLLPDIRKNNESIAVFSDYGGESSESLYNTYSFLVCAWNQTAPFKNHMDAVRQEYRLNDPFKEISFKDFGYGPISRALTKYLAGLGGLVNGYMFTVVISKDVPSIFGGENKRVMRREIAKALKDADLGEWKPDVSEKLLRITHFAAYLVALLCRPGHKVFWMTDNDSIADNPALHQKTLQIFANILQKYCKHELSVIGGAIPFEKDDHSLLDLLSAADVVAGSVEHYMTREKKLGDDLTIKEEAEKVLSWLTGHGILLKKHTMIIKLDGQSIVSGTLNFELREPDLNATVINIELK